MRRVRAIEGNVLLFSSGHFLGVLAARWLGLEPEAGKFFFLSTVSQKLWLRSDRAAIGRARGQEQEAFAPFLPLIDVLGRYGAVSANLAPGRAANEGFLLSTTLGTRSYAQTKLGLEWILYDFGRTGGRCRQAVARERIAELQGVRADQTVAFDVAAAYLDVLLARASRRVQEEAIRCAEAILADTRTRREAGVVLREDVLRADVQLSESREALVLALEAEFDAVARLNNAMGRNAGLPLEVIDLEAQPPLPRALAHFLEQAAAQAARARAQAEFSRAEQALAARIGEEHALVAEAKAELEEARLNLEWTRIYAPANGYVTFVQLREGFYVHAGEPVLTFIDADQWWVVANYRENSLEHIRPGQRVGLTFNTYPGRIFPGVVQTVSWGVNQGQGKPSGNLPAVSEPPNWIRLAQRFQVWVIPELPEGHPIRVGTTASVVVYTREKYWLNAVTEIWQKIVAYWDYLY